MGSGNDAKLHPCKTTLNNAILRKLGGLRPPDPPLRKLGGLRPPDPPLSSVASLRDGREAPKAPKMVDLASQQNKTKQNTAFLTSEVGFLTCHSGRVLFCFVLGKNFWTDVGAQPSLPGEPNFAPPPVPIHWDPAEMTPYQFGHPPAGKNPLTS